MQLSILLPFISAVVAWPPWQRQIDIRPWVPAGPSDSRAPCPMMNTLANHGYLPHNGIRISAENISIALAEAIHFAREDALIIAQQAFAKLGNPHFINLGDLNTHGVTEHDASLTREDQPGDSLHVNNYLVNALLADTQESYLSIASLAKSRNRVEALSPPLTDNFKRQSLGEAALILQIISKDPIPLTATAEDYRQIQAPKDRVSLWLSKEILPVELGWKVPSHPFLNFTLFAIANEIEAAQAEQ